QIDGCTLYSVGNAMLVGYLPNANTGSGRPVFVPLDDNTLPLIGNLYSTTVATRLATFISEINDVLDDDSESVGTVTLPVYIPPEPPGPEPGGAFTGTLH